jgi:hypothetical protein
VTREIQLAEKLIEGMSLSGPGDIKLFFLLKEIKEKLVKTFL